VPHRFLALYFDFGDTLIDQATEVKDESFTTLQAELIPGVVDLLHELKRRGYRLGLVSNGPVGSIPNVLGAYGLYEFFDVLAVSQGLGVDKPDARIFITHSNTWAFLKASMSARSWLGMIWLPTSRARTP
jgi:phosphoglycolate phosphatase-like HAD superfamily hydrolase